MQNFYEDERRRLLGNNSSTTFLSSMGAIFAPEPNWDDSIAHTPTSSPETYFNANSGDMSIFHSSFNGFTNSSSHMFGSPLNQNMTLLANNGAEPILSCDFETHDGLPNFVVGVSSYEDCISHVAPSQTFLNFETVSPIRISTSSQSKIEYGSPTSEYQTEYYSALSSQASSPCSSFMSMSPTFSPALACSRHLQIKPEVLKSSSALQNVQSASKAPTTTPRRQYKTQQRRSKAITSEQEFREQFPDTNLKRSGSRKHACSVPGCKARFERTEHVKRHEATVHAPAKFKCRFCPLDKEKCFPRGRMDNYKDHLKRHADKKESRTEYNPEAAFELDLMNSRAGKRGKKNTRKH